MISGSLLVIIAVFLVIFSLQNGGGVIVYFLIWKLELSLSAVVVAAVLTGIIVTQLLRSVMAKRQERTGNTVDSLSSKLR